MDMVQLMVVSSCISLVSELAKEELLRASASLEGNKEWLPLHAAVQWLGRKNAKNAETAWSQTVRQPWQGRAKKPCSYFSQLVHHLPCQHEPGYGTSALSSPTHPETGSKKVRIEWRQSKGLTMPSAFALYIYIYFHYVSLIRQLSLTPHTVALWHQAAAIFSPKKIQNAKGLDHCALNCALPAVAGSAPWSSTPSLCHHNRAVVRDLAYLRGGLHAQGTVLEGMLPTHFFAQHCEYLQSCQSAEAEPWKSHWCSNSWWCWGSWIEWCRWYHAVPSGRLLYRHGMAGLLYIM